MTASRLLLLPLVAGALGCEPVAGPIFELAGHRYDPSTARHLALPKVLRETSGLAVDRRGHAYSHNDERGIVYRIDPDAGRVTAEFELDGDVREDFEGIAAIDERLYLVTSRGEIFEIPIDPDAIGAVQTVPYIRHRERRDCEVEGLAAERRRGLLLVACKNIPGNDSHIVIHGWDPDRRTYLASPVLSVPVASVNRLIGQAHPGADAFPTIQPSGIDVTDNGHVLLIAAGQRLLLEFSADGHPTGAVRLDPDIHRQAEGIAITVDGRLLIASEGDSRGDKKSAGVLSVYEPID